MPVPKPRSGESEDDFMGRCVEFLLAEGTDQEQAVAICARQWDNKACGGRAMEIKNLKQDEFQIKDRVIIGYAAAFGNVDRVGDIIEPGAFKKTISERRPKVFYNHSYPIGLPTEIREDSKGLYTESKVSNTPRGDEILELVKDGVISEMSIAYEVVKYDIDNEKDIRKLKELKLYEYGPVDFPANESAVITGVKALAESLYNVNKGTESIESISMLIKALESMTRTEQPDQSTATEEPEESTLEVQWFKSIGEDVHKLADIVRQKPNKE